MIRVKGDSPLGPHASLEALKRKHWLPSIIPGEDAFGWGSFFRSCRACPKCHHDLATNGRGAFRCPACHYTETGTASQGRQRRVRRRKKEG